MSETPALTAWTIAAALLTGLLLALLGNLKMSVALHPDQASHPLARLLFLLHIVLIPLLLASGVLIDWLGLMPVMIGAPVLLALAFMALGAGGGARRSQVAVVVAGLAAASIATASVVLMPGAFFGSDEPVASLQLGMVLVPLAALASAPLLDLLFRGIGFRRTMAVLALASLLPAFLAPLAGSTAPATHASLGLLTDFRLWLACLVFFLYAPLEGFVSVWVCAHQASLGQPPRIASRFLFAFWGSMLLSRLLLAVLLHSTNHWYWFTHLSPWILVLLTVLVAVMLGNLGGMGQSDRADWRMVLLGLCMGPIFPFLVGLVGLLYRTSSGQAMPATAYGLVCAGGSVGGLVLAPVVGYCARSRSRQFALVVPIILALILTGAALLFALATQMEHGDDSAANEQSSRRLLDLPVLRPRLGAVAVDAVDARVGEPRRGRDVRHPVGLLLPDRLHQGQQIIPLAGPAPRRHILLVARPALFQVAHQDLVARFQRRIFGVEHLDHGDLDIVLAGRRGQLRDHIDL
jgi:hypothetical protein